MSACVSRPARDHSGRRRAAILTLTFHFYRSTVRHGPVYCTVCYVLCYVMLGTVRVLRERASSWAIVNVHVQIRIGTF